MDPLGKLQVAIKNNVDVHYFSCVTPYHVLFTEDGQLDKSDYLRLWKEVGDGTESINQVNLFSNNVDAVLARLTANNIFTIARRKVNDQELVYLSLKFTNNIVGLAELTVRQSGPANVAVRANVPDVVPGIHEVFGFLLGSSSEA